MAMQCQLWMGSLEPNMTESFIMAAFHRMGQRPLAVKVMRNKFTGEPAGYAFVHFQTDEEAIDTMHKLNGKPIPGTFPVVRFRLNTASREARSNMQQEREFSVWVGDLSPDVDDYSLYRVFASKYSSIKTAKVILDSSGYTKGYGFVRFGNEEEQRNALYAMNGYTGLGTKPLKICTAVPKPKSAQTPQTQQSNTVQGQTAYNSGTEYNQYYDPSAYWQNYSAWSGYYGQGEQAAAVAPAAPQVDTTHATPAKTQNDDLALVVQKETTGVWCEDAKRFIAEIGRRLKERGGDNRSGAYLVQRVSLAIQRGNATSVMGTFAPDHKKTIDVDAMNQEFLDPELSVWDALESSQWFPQEIVEAH